MDMNNINVGITNDTVILPRREYASLVRASEMLSIMCRLSANKEIPSYAMYDILSTLLSPNSPIEEAANDEV